MTVPIEQDCPALALILPWWAGLNKAEQWTALCQHRRNWLRLDHDADIIILGKIYAKAHGIRLNIDTR